MSDTIKESAEDAKASLTAAGEAVSATASEWADKAGDAANSARESVEAGATKADAAIQGAIGNDSAK